MSYPDYFSPSPFEIEQRRKKMNAIFGDFIVGFAVGQITMFHIGLWSLLVGVLTANLFILGGQGWLGFNAWRRVGVPFVIFLAMKWGNPSGWPYLGALTMFGALSIGYGVPDSTDEGSWLGRHFNYPRVVWYCILAVSIIPFFL